MDFLGKIIELPPPSYFPPPPKRTTVHGERDMTVVSAADKGFTPNTSPTSTLSSITETQAKDAFLVRYIRDLNLTGSDVKAVYPPGVTESNETMASLNARAFRRRTIIGNSFLSTGGIASKERWLSRVVTGFVAVHDYDAHMHNLQCAILAASLVPANETVVDRGRRESALFSLRWSFYGHRFAMLEKIDRAKDEAIRNAQEQNASDTYGDLTNPWYNNYLDELRAEYSSKTLWTLVQDRFDIPARRLTYAETYGQGHRNFHDFWAPIWRIPGYAASFMSDFMFVIHLPSALNTTTHFQCASHLQFLFHVAAHYSWTMVAFRRIQDLRLKTRQVMSAEGNVIGRNVDPFAFFNTMREAVIKQPEEAAIDFTHIPVRDVDVSAIMRRSAKRTRTDSDDYSGFRAYRQRIQ